jgi:hypothetical protein
MKNGIILFVILVMTSCTKDEMFLDIEEQVEKNESTSIDVPVNVPKTFKLYNESHLNQKSGITWTWGDWDNQPKTTPFPSYFSNGQS